MERHPGLAVEADLVRAAVDRDVPLFGVCLGHQIIATALGASLHPGAAREVGVGTVDVIADDVLGPAGGTQPVVHWHHDVVDAPAGARVIASTAQTPNQAFRVGDTVFATQFHLEVDEPLLAEWITVPEMAADLPPGTDLLGDFRAVRPRIEAAAQTAFGAFAAAVRARM